MKRIQTCANLHLFDAFYGPAICKQNTRMLQLRSSIWKIIFNAGSLGVNAATFAGTKTAGMLGGIFAVLGVLSPTLTLTLLAAVFFQKFRTSKVMSYIMRIVKPICIGMVLGVLVGLCRQSYLTEAGGISLPGLCIGILCFVLLQKFKLSVPKVIGIAAALGLVCFGVF